MRLSALFLLPAIALIASCAREPTDAVRGAVTFDGAPLAKGFITFYPVPKDDRGPTRGAPIVMGVYEVKGMTPGRKRVLITATPEVDHPPDRPKPKLTLPVPISPKTPGNDREVEVPPGRHTLNFELMRM